MRPTVEAAAVLYIEYQKYELKWVVIPKFSPSLFPTSLDDPGIPGSCDLIALLSLLSCRISCPRKNPTLLQFTSTVFPK